MKYTITTLWLILAFVGMSVSPLWADIVIVESRTGGQNYASYSESQKMSVFSLPAQDHVGGEGEPDEVERYENGQDLPD